MTIAEIAAVYDARAAIPSDGSRAARAVAADIAWMAEHGVDPVHAVLDVGCGHGWHLRALASRGCRALFGLDVSLRALEAAASLLAEMEAVLVAADIVDWRASASAFDVVTAFNACIGARPRADDRRVLAAMRRSLRAGGRLFVTYFGREIAARHTGDFLVGYSADCPDPTASCVTMEGDDLVISQRFRGGRLPVERISTIPEAEFEAELVSLGFEIVDSSRANGGPMPDDFHALSAVAARAR